MLGRLLGFAWLVLALGAGAAGCGGGGSGDDGGTDEGCVPGCGDRRCGIDPVCGESCGSCDPDSEWCDEEHGRCECLPDCGDRQCGADLRCGVSCGSCDPQGEYCHQPSGQCRCAPDCGDRQCGTDPVCGESCGQCHPEYEECDAQSGRCERVCSLAPLQQDSWLELDVRLVRVQGEVTVDGGPMPDDGDLDGWSRGWLQFRNVETGSSWSVDLGERGPAAFESELFAGIYDVVVSTRAGDFQDALPELQQLLVHRRLVLEADREFEIDLQLVRVRGEITVGDDTMPDDSIADGWSRGWVWFRNVDTDSNWYAYLGETGRASFDTQVFAGRYDVTVGTRAASYQDALPAEQRLRLHSALPLSADVVLEENVELVGVTGELEINGEQMLDDTVDDGRARAFVEFRNVETDSTRVAPVGELGAATFSSEVFAGRYHVTVVTGTAEHQDALPERQRVRLHRELSVVADRELAEDLQLVSVHGEVSLNGAPMPDDGRLDGWSRGFVEFRNPETDSSWIAYLGETGPASFDAELFAADYQLLLATRGAGQQDVLPPNQRLLLQPELALAADHELSANVDLVRVFGEVRVDGGPMPDDGQLDGNRRGWVQFENPDTGSQITATLGETGPGAFEAELLAATYQVRFGTDDGAHQDALPPNQQVTLAQARSVTADWELNADLSRLRVTGTVSLDGETMPDDGELDGWSRGWVQLRRLDTQSSRYAYFGETGAAAFDVELFAGSADVLFGTRDAAQQDALPPNQTLLIHTGCHAE